MREVVAVPATAFLADDLDATSPEREAAPTVVEVVVSPFLT
jgi:hypothetical protein